MTLEFFRSTDNSNHVAIYSNGQIRISARAVRDFNLTDWESVIMGYDSEKNIIVLKKPQKGEFGVLNFKHHHQGKVSNASVSAWRVFKYFNIDVSSICGKRYELKKQNDDSVEFCLKNKI